MIAKRQIRKRQLKRELEGLRRISEATKPDKALKDIEKLVDLLANAKRQRFEVVKSFVRWARDEGLTHDPSVQRVGKMLGAVSDGISQADQRARQVEVMLNVVASRLSRQG